MGLSSQFVLQTQTVRIWIHNLELRSSQCNSLASPYLDRFSSDAAQRAAGVVRILIMGGQAIWKGHTLVLRKTCVETKHFWMFFRGWMQNFARECVTPKNVPWKKQTFRSELVDINFFSVGFLLSLSGYAHEADIQMQTMSPVHFHCNRITGLFGVGSGSNVDAVTNGSTNTTPPHAYIWIENNINDKNVICDAVK